MSGAPTEEEMISGMHAAVRKTRKTSEPEPEAPRNTAQLRNLVDRIIRLEEEKKETSSAIKDIYVEADSAGYSKKAVRVIVKREMETADQRTAREQTESDVEIMLAALGDFVSSPLGEAAMRGARKQ